MSLIQKIIPPHLSENPARAFARQRVEEARRDNATRMPDWLKSNRNAYRERLAAAAGRCHEETGIWFLARGAARDADEQETVAVWGDLLYFDPIEKLPGYSQANHQQAVKFWQSWQNLKTGRLYNPLYQDPQNPEVRRVTPGNRPDYTADSINLKYIPVILEMLGTGLPMPCKTEAHADAVVDTFDNLWGEISQWSASHAGMFPITAAYSLEAGNLSKLPQVEAGMGALLRTYRKDTGMWRPEPFEGFPWRDYNPSSGFKIISRLCGDVGMENFPKHLATTAVDNLLAHKGELYDHPAMARNYGETLAHYLMLSDYRHDEVLDAMEECLNGFRDPAMWEDTDTGCYCVFGSGLIGAFMNWEDMPFDQALREWHRFRHGCGMQWRFVADPYGNWVNVLPKEPEEVFGHPAYDVNRFGLRVRHKEHWAKRTTEVVPQKSVALRTGAGAAGEGSLSFTLTTDQLASLAAPYVKATWSGACDVFLNGVLVKQVRYNLPDRPAGWHVPVAAASTLRIGTNAFTVKISGPGKEPIPSAPPAAATPFINLGLLDWR